MHVCALHIHFTLQVIILGRSLQCVNIKLISLPYFFASENLVEIFRLLFVLRNVIKHKSKIFNWITCSFFLGKNKILAQRLFYTSKGNVAFYTILFLKKRLENDKGKTCILVAVVAITAAEVVDVVVVATTAAATVAIRTCIVTPDRDSLLLTHRSSDGSLPGTLEYST